MDANWDGSRFDHMEELMPKGNFPPEKVLKDWRELIQAIPLMDEEELKAALNVEVSGERRKDFIIRLHRRYNKLRSERELEELLT